MRGPENPGDIPTIRKLAALKQYGLLNGIPPGFSPAERFFRQRPKGYGVTSRAGALPYRSKFLKGKYVVYSLVYKDSLITDTYML
ncbi:MAG: hypothetical protein H6Q72_882 [Firmicutes bacterium]|nr:hypothetical protein [Bacillota bacterium]